MLMNLYGRLLVTAASFYVLLKLSRGVSPVAARARDRGYNGAMMQFFDTDHRDKAAIPAIADDIAHFLAARNER